MHFAMPRMWVGQTAVILASGPSMSESVAQSVHESGCRSIAVNNTFRLAPWADILYAADEVWWKNTPDAMQFAGLKVSVGCIKGVHQMRNSGKVGFDPDPTALRTGGNSGYQAIHLAAHAGAATILLCGFDMHTRDGHHWHADHVAPLRMTHADHYPNWIRHFETLHTDLRNRGVMVFNCTPGSAVTAFPKKPLQEALAEHGNG